MDRLLAVALVAVLLTGCKLGDAMRMEEGPEGERRLTLDTEGVEGAPPINVEVEVPPVGDGGSPWVELGLAVLGTFFLANRTKPIRWEKALE